MLPRRELTVAVIEKAQGKTIKIKNINIMNNNTINGRPLINPDFIKISRGTLIKAIVTINVNEAALPKKPKIVIPIDVNVALTPPAESSTIQQCDLLIQPYFNKLNDKLKLNIKEDLKICRIIASTPQTVLTHITKSLRKCDNLIAQLIIATTRYKKIKQDIISYFIPLKPGGTLLVVIMKIEPGDDVPKWAVEPLVSSFGVNIMKLLGGYLRNMKPVKK